jgi:hypothetical protein
VQVAVLIVSFLILLNLGTYGWTLFLTIPFSIGLTCGYYSRTLRSNKFLKTTFFLLLGLAIFSGLLVATGTEGAICILMAEGLLMLPAFLGMVSGYFIRNLYLSTVIIFIVVLNTSFTFYDVTDSTSVESLAVEMVIINATKEKIWKALTQPVSFSSNKNLFFEAGVTYPTSMQLNYDEKGKCFLSCQLNNGIAALAVDKLDSLRRIRFRIPNEIQTMKELTFYDSLEAPHLKGYFEASYGEFEIEPLSKDQCRLIARTQYRSRITPAFYWQLWSDYLVNTMHRHVLNDIKQLAESM